VRHDSFRELKANTLPGNRQGRAIPFGKYDVDPAHMEAMRSAFQKVCEALQSKCDLDDPRHANRKASGSRRVLLDLATIARPKGGET
jgi:hypothetical protein